MVDNSSASSATYAAMANQTARDAALPPLPSYTLYPQPDLVSWFPDLWMSLLMPVIVYWVWSAVYHLVDTLDLFPDYRLHTPEEISSRNHVSRWQCFRDVIVQQVVQVVTGYVLTLSEQDEQTGKGDYNLAVWATRVRLAQRFLPGLLGLVGLDASSISKNMSAEHPLLAGALAGGYYPTLMTEADGPGFAYWEMAVAKLVYYLVIPGIQLFVACCLLDAWQYFLHRGMHMNLWLYTKIHSRHHRLYVPYAYGALYNHPVEGFLLDTLGAGLAYKATGMSLRQGTFFFSFSTIKTVDDHCGYKFPWNPIQHLSSNNAAYHDIHHQTWGIKTNFSQPFFTFWDGFLNTKYRGNKQDRLAEKRRIETEKKKAARAI